MLTLTSTTFDGIMKEFMGLIHKRREDGRTFVMLERSLNESQYNVCKPQESFIRETLSNTFGNSFININLNRDIFPGYIFSVLIEFDD